MITPYSIENLFDLNPDAKIYCKNNVIYVDDVYKNFDQIVEVLNNAAVENWKIHPNSRNFKDYYDCRLYINNRHYSQDIIMQRQNSYISLVKHFFNDTSDLRGEIQLRFNFFKHIKKDVSQDLQHYPHIDNNSKYNVLTYFDEVSKGGTAIYSRLKNVDYSEEECMLVNLKKYNYEIVDIIEAKPNRCVIFDGNIPHGGFITDHKAYENNWRINQLGLIY